MKFSKYNTVADTKDGIVLINVFNSKYVKINKEEEITHFFDLYKGRIELSKDDDMVMQLYNSGFIVDDSIDEYKLAQEEVQKYIDSRSKQLSVLLYVTDQCNFRCVYCPEKHEDNYFSDKRYEGLFKYIEKGVKEGQFTSIEMLFFGGEPLICADKIISFLEKLNTLKEINPDLLLYHQVTTNAYLLTPEIYDKLVALNLKNYQITVDGFGETHNKTRPLAGGQPSWDKIIENLKYINTKNDGARIILRANYNDESLGTLVEYKKWERETFTNPKFMFAFEPVSKFSDIVPEEHLSDRYSEESLSVLDEIDNGFNIFKKASGICISSFPNNYTITTDGRIAKCINTYLSNEDLYIGRMSEDGEVVFYDNKKDWEENFEIEECKDCIIYPVCCARTCPSKKTLHPDTRPDCSMVKERFEKRMLHFAENKI